MNFTESLEVGQIGEDEISRWLIGKGYQVLPAYQIEQGHGKGPRLFTAEGNLIAPDLLVFKEGKVLWAEAKTKSAFTWHRASNTWQTGIDKRHWTHYVQVDLVSPWRVWLLFLHRGGCLAKDTPEGLVSPSGLFGNSVRELKGKVHHKYEGKDHAMVYWTMGSLRRFDFPPTPSEGGER